MKNIPPPYTGVKRIIHATYYSWAGIKSGWQNEAAFRQECLMAIVLIPITLFLPVTSLEKGLLIGSVLLVLVVELLNSAIEAVVDRVSVEHHDLSKRAKDMGSAAVFFALLNVLVLWSVILYPLLIEFL